MTLIRSIKSFRMSDRYLSRRSLFITSSIEGSTVDSSERSFRYISLYERKVIDHESCFAFDDHASASFFSINSNSTEAVSCRFLRVCNSRVFEKLFVESIFIGLRCIVHNRPPEAMIRAEQQRNKIML